MFCYLAKPDDCVLAETGTQPIDQGLPILTPLAGLLEDIQVERVERNDFVHSERNSLYRRVQVSALQSLASQSQQMLGVTARSRQSKPKTRGRASSVK